MLSILVSTVDTLGVTYSHNLSVSLFQDAPRCYGNVLSVHDGHTLFCPRFWDAVNDASVSHGSGMALAAASVAYSIYDDKLENTFADWSWCTRSLTQNVIVHSGTQAISMAANSWQGLRLCVAQLPSTKPFCKPLLKTVSCAVDIGDANTIHPPNKWDVGARLALQAQTLVYGQSIESWGPVYNHLVVEGSTLRLYFDHASEGLMVGLKTGIAPVSSVSGGVLKSFAIADASYNWVAATAVIDGDTLVVSAPSVSKPVAVRYGWAANPPCNLYNTSGLPASPFRTDNVPLH